MIKHFESSHNSKFAVFLWYLKKEFRDEFYFLHVDKHQSFLQGDTIVIDSHDGAFPKY